MRFPLAYDWRKLIVGVALAAIFGGAAVNIAYGQMVPTISYSPPIPIANQPIEFYYSGGGPNNLAIYAGTSCPGLQDLEGPNSLVTLVLHPGQDNVILTGGLPAGWYSVGTYYLSRSQDQGPILICKNFQVIASSQVFKN